jgi:hypothetical protein
MPVLPEDRHGQTGFSGYIFDDKAQELAESINILYLLWKLNIDKLSLVFYKPKLFAFFVCPDSSVGRARD